MGSGPVEIFLSYSRKDEELLRELERHLAALRREGKIATWKDRMLEAGADWGPELRQRLESAHVILLLISSDFLASEYCWSVEMAAALDRHEAGSARVIPIILRTCDWRNTPLGKLQVLPEDGRPIRKWQDLDDAFFDVVQGIRNVLVDPTGSERAITSKTTNSQRLARSSTSTRLATKPPIGTRLRPELGVHTGWVIPMAVDLFENFLVTGSTDGTVRIWNLRNGELLQVLRPPLTPANEGTFHCVAMSPDGLRIAASAGQRLYFFDRISGMIQRCIDGLPKIVSELAFSSDGSRLAVVCADPRGLYVFDGNGRQLLANPPQEGCCHVSYAQDNRLAVGLDHGIVHLYSDKLELLAKGAVIATPNAISAMAVSPNGDEIAVAYFRGERIDVLSSSNLKVKFSAALRSDVATLQTVTWSADGRSLFAIGTGRVPGKEIICFCLRAGRGSFTDVPAPADGVMALYRLRDGRLVCATQSPGWTLLSSKGVSALEKTRAHANFDGPPTTFRTNVDGSQVSCVVDRSLQLTFFQRANRRLELAPPPPNLDTPVTTAPWLKWNGGGELPQINGIALELQNYEYSFCLAVSRDNHSLLLGTDEHLYLFRNDGLQVWASSIRWMAVQVIFSGDGRVALASFDDGTIRWYRASDGEELLNLFLHVDGQRWFLWTRSGYYDASPDGEDLFGWHVNRGLDQAADFYPAATFRDHFYRPDVIDLILETLDEAEALRLADENSSSPRG
jgi:hypothetical protein